MENNNVKKKVLSGLIWKFLERISSQLVTFVVSVILARLLDVASYGAIAIVNIFIALSNTIVTSGFSSSLIQKKNSDDLDFSSVFYFNIAFGFVMYMVIYAIAPIIASFYNLEILKSVLRFMGLNIIIVSINSVQQAYVSKNMLFKRFFTSTFGATLLSGICGIAAAYCSMGIWALAIQYTLNNLLATAILWFTVKWRPKCEFSLNRVGQLFSYGWKMLVSGLLDTGANEIRSLIIGKVYTSTDLAYYNKGKSFPSLVVTNINASIQSVLFPAISSVQDNRDAVKAMTRRSIRVSGFIMFPLMIGLAFVARPFINLLLTEKWLGCVVYLQIYCFILALMPIHTSNLQAIKAMGRSDIFLKLEIIKKIIGISSLLISMRFGVLAIALSAAINTIISSFVNAFPNKKLIGYSYFEQIKDLFNGIVPLLAMVAAVVGVKFLNINDFSMLVIQIVIGAITYIAVSAGTKNESFRYILSIIKEFKEKRG